VSPCFTPAPSAIESYLLHTAGQVALISTDALATLAEKKYRVHQRLWLHHRCRHVGARIVYQGKVAALAEASKARSKEVGGHVGIVPTGSVMIE
jgi:hypothetical protein